MRLFSSEGKMKNAEAVRLRLEPVV